MSSIESPDLKACATRSSLSGTGSDRAAMIALLSMARAISVPGSSMSSKPVRPVSIELIAF